MIDECIYTLTEQGSDGWVDIGSERFLLEKEGTLVSLVRERLESVGEELREEVGAKTRKLSPTHALRVKLPASASPEVIIGKGVPKAYAALTYEHDKAYLPPEPEDSLRRTTRTICEGKDVRKAIDAAAGQRGALASLADQAFRLRSVRSAPDLVVENGNHHQYRLEPLGTSEELVEFHDRSLRESIAQDRRNLEKLLEKETRAHNKRLRKLLAEPRDHTIRIEKQRKGFTIFVTSQPYLIAHQGVQHKFEGFTMTYVVNHEKGKWRFMGEPTIQRPHRYKHPFVYSDNSICFKESGLYSKTKRWKQAGIPLDSWIELPKDPAEAALKLAFPAFEGLSLLHQGYSEQANPVHKISGMDICKYPSEGVHIYESIDTRRDRKRA